ncbi:hypothetical protein SAY87_012174 [Trapa incisa]|uniref:NAC domain-containing protein n=1 Tax=Trapa incisa TaxID=236973 RepID=A0AAN7GT06_9MYRT|nr:hypothetical protein SAY87_012174 [Trapa incisa]
MRKTLVFYRNRAPNGIKTDWIMHEFRLETLHMPPKEDWVLCRVFHRSKASPESIHGSNVELSHPFIPEMAMLSPPSSDYLAFMGHGYGTANHNYDHPMLLPSTSINAGGSVRSDSSSSLLHLLHQHLPDSSSSGIGCKGEEDAYGEFFWGNHGVPTDGTGDAGGDRMRLDLDGENSLIFQ